MVAFLFSPTGRHGTTFFTLLTAGSILRFVFVGMALVGLARNLWMSPQAIVLLDEEPSSSSSSFPSWSVQEMKMTTSFSKKNDHDKESSLVVSGATNNATSTKVPRSTLHCPSSTTTITTTNGTSTPMHFHKNQTTMDDSMEEISWRIVVTGNSGYEQDLLTWWYHCQKVGFYYNALRDPTPPSPATPDDCPRHPPVLLTPNVVFYAEDPAIYHRYKDSLNLIVKQAWHIPTKFANNATIVNATTPNSTDPLIGEARFSYSDQKLFFHMMSRRPTIVLQELQEVARLEQQLQQQQNGEHARHKMGVIFCDLDVFLLQDPRPYFRNRPPSTDDQHHKNTVVDDDDELDLWGADACNPQTGPYNAGFLAMRTTMIHVIQAWRDLLESRTKPSPNQISFNNILRRHNQRAKRNPAVLVPAVVPTTNPDAPSILPSNGTSPVATTSPTARNTIIRHQLLSKEKFPVGKIFQSSSSSANKKKNKKGKKKKLENSPVFLPIDPSIVVAFHNNWCEGMCNKTQRAMDLGLWHPTSYHEIMGRPPG